MSIGFCQYYDTFYAQEHEVWNDEWAVSEGPGGIYSIDYLIGEATYLRRALGRQIIMQLLERLQKNECKNGDRGAEPENTASGRVLEACGSVWNGRDDYIPMEK